MDSANEARPAVRRLTKQQRHFVRAYVWERKTKSEALRAAYLTKGNPHSVSIQAYRLAKIPHVAQAIGQAESGDWDTLISCGVDPSLLAHRKLLGMIDDPQTPHYVRQRALVDVLRYQPQRNPIEKQPTLQELEQVIRENVAVANDPGEEWDDLSLDDPLPAPSETPRAYPQEHPSLPDTRFQFRNRRNDPHVEDHPFLTKPQRTRRPPF